MYSDQIGHCIVQTWHFRSERGHGSEGMADNPVNWDKARHTGVHGHIRHMQVDISVRKRDEHCKDGNRGLKLARHSWSCDL